MRNHLYKFVALVIFIGANSAFAAVPILEGRGGAGRAGSPGASLFSNPASAAFLKENRAFYTYTQSNIDDLDAGGKTWAAGVYDGTTSEWHGGAGYERESRRIRSAGGTTYADHTTMRLVLGGPISGPVFGGIRVKYVQRRVSGVEDKHFVFDAGIIYPQIFFPNFTLGVTLENVSNKTGEVPRSAYLAGQYDISGPLVIYGDIGRVLSGNTSGKHSWAYGIDLHIFDQVVLRGGMFRDAILVTRGLAAGISWNGPRTHFEYALRSTRHAPKQLDHVFGISVGF